VLDWDRSSMEARDGVLKTIEYRVRRPGCVELLETGPLDLFDKQWESITLAGRDSLCLRTATLIPIDLRPPRPST